MRLSRIVLATCAALFVVSQILFLVNIQFPRGPNFDEFHYIPSAKQFLHLQPNQNWEHPPLAKEIMAAGIAIWGDRPIGWRYMSTLFGSLTLVGMYLWALALFRDRKIALWAALLTLVNQLLYVQARIGMLDTFMFAFIVWGMAAFTATWQIELGAKPAKRRDENKASPLRLSDQDIRRLLLAMGVFFGLATACKWFGVIPWAFCAGCVALVRILELWKTKFEDSTEDDWYHPSLWSGVRPIDWVLCFLIVPLAAYYVTFIPFFFIHGANTTLWDVLVGMQLKMWDGQGRVVNSHPYMSSWTQWASLKRPIWYAFDKEGNQQESVRGVLLLGNPLLMWGGFIAMILSAWGWVTERHRDAFLITATYAAFYFSWAIIPRKVTFFYYYYPAGMVLSLAIAYVFFHGEKKLVRQPWPRWLFLAAATAMFIYFFPISAALKIPAESFRKWMWLQSWI